MKVTTFNYLFIIIISSYGFHCTPCLMTLQFILDYAIERSWDQLVLFDVLDSEGCVLKYIRPFMKCLAENGITSTIQPAINPNVPAVFNINRHRVTAIVFLDNFNLTASDNVLNLASQKLLFNYYISWLFVNTNASVQSTNAIIKELAIAIDSDVILATTFLDNYELTEWSISYRERFCDSLKKYIPKTEANHFENSDSEKDGTSEFGNHTAFYLSHVYKIRINDNSSLIIDHLGGWNPFASRLTRPVSVELRKHFQGFPLKIGLYNGSLETRLDQTVDKQLYDNVKPMIKYIQDIARMMNATTELTQHDKLGSLTNKAWTDLLHDVVNNNVDIGVGYITTTEERQEYMSFSFPVVKYMRNIYFVPPSSGKTRNIFLQPFNSELLLCVCVTYFFIVATMEMITFVAKITNHHTDEKHAGLGEATLWCVSILCMQGSPWTPISRSGKTVLMVGLLFALVIYNSYAGFITSILSVQSHAIKTIDDLKQFNFKIGFDSDDEEFIRTTNDSNLRDIYINAYNSRESGLNAIDGLLKVLNGSYGFFVSASLARHFLKTTLIQEQCLMRELKLAQTESQVAFPMSKNCPYQKIINFNILRTREFGILSRVGQELLPDMPRCVNPSRFNTARISDVYWAFYILLLGLTTSISIGLVERGWNNRLAIKRKILKNILHRK